MAWYLILGAGKFGRLAQQRLAAEDHKARFVIVDRRPKAAAALPSRPGAETVEADAIRYLVAHLSPESSWDWLIPAVPVHVAYGWLLEGPLAGQGWETAPVPEDLAGLAALALRGAQGELYLSRAQHRCPADCAEPPVCPVTGEERDKPLFDKLREASRPGLPVLVVASRQLAPGVGGYAPRKLLELAAAAAGAGERFLVATACRCHGVVHGLQRKGGTSAKIM
uniref:RCK N-terminal domain-containing protein n=1 Tax=Desulfobacca acetoxidans TaxID=60893 RepID=A0A7C3Z927_9BACT